MWKIAARVEPNKGGSSKRKLRLYALKGQPVPDTAAISCDVADRTDGDYFIADVARRANSPTREGGFYVRKTVDRQFDRVSKRKALAFVARTYEG